MRRFEYSPAIEIFFTPLSWHLTARMDREGASVALGPLTIVLLWRLR